jgi:hypothetical protein
VAAYGYHPEIGLLWICGFVVLGAIIFKTGAHKMLGEKRPHNWFVFSLDAVIPGIDLDKDHRDIRFSGWRQDFLVFLRFLGAVVVVVIIGILKQSFDGIK